MEAENEVFELCKQVHEATGWEQSPNISQLYEYWDDYDELCVISIEDADDTLVPAYTSDYLLEKLPHTLSDNDGDRYTITVHKVGDSWLANYTFDNVGMHHIYADTPLKALLKLTLKLHEEKTL